MMLLDLQPSLLGYRIGMSLAYKGKVERPYNEATVKHDRLSYALVIF